MSAGLVLIADADTELLSVLSLHLCNDDYTVICASEGGEALELAKRENPGVLLLDLSLTINDGPTVFDCLTDRPDLLPIPIVYMLAPRAQRQKKTGLPDQVILRKPVAVGELRRKVELALGGALPIAVTPLANPADDDDTSDAQRPCTPKPMPLAPPGRYPHEESTTGGR